MPELDPELDQELDKDAAVFFSFFNEIGIIAQLSAKLFERSLPEGFLVSHFAVLNHLVRLGDRRTPLAIARAFQVPKTTMTHTLSGLERAGLIRFAPNPDDGRSKCVVLTDDGRRFRDEAVARLRPAVSEMTRHVPRVRVADALPVLAEIRDYLDRERDG